MAMLSVHASAKNSTRTEIRAGKHTILIDEPPFFGGADEAPSPVETLLAALAGALNAIGQYVAKELDMPLKGLEIQIDGDCNADCFFGKSFEQRAGFHEIRIDLHADTDADEETLNIWKERVLSRCPVLDNLLAPVKVISNIHR